MHHLLACWLKWAKAFFTCEFSSSLQFEQMKEVELALFSCSRKNTARHSVHRVFKFILPNKSTFAAGCDDSGTWAACKTRKQGAMINFYTYKVKLTWWSSKSLTASWSTWRSFSICIMSLSTGWLAGSVMYLDFKSNATSLQELNWTPDGLMVSRKQEF